MTTENNASEMNQNAAASANADIPPQPVLAAPVPKPPRVFTSRERWLVLVATAIGILYDRLIINNLESSDVVLFSGIFWLVYLLAFYLLFWNRIKTSKILWTVGGFAAALCCWPMIFDGASSYGFLNFLVVPAVMMGHAVFFCGGYTLAEPGKVALEWLAGWFIKPFLAINIFFGAMSSSAKDEKRATAKKIFTALTISAGMMLVILPLLLSADMVFSYYLKELVGDFNISTLFWHLVAVFIAAILFYSFLWNIGFAPRKSAQNNEKKPRRELDLLISCIVLGVVLFTYMLFCSVQFTYLFAGAGLPGNMTYSEYAREGFAQIIVVCALNLLIFGVFLQFGKKNTALRAMLVALLVLSGIMLTSGFARLRLYISVYDLTWLRLLSMWFIIYLAAVLVLCGARMIKEGLPLIGICAIILLGWYTVLGYANPDALVLKYNLEANDYSVAWLEDNRRYIRYDISNNGLIVLLESDIPAEAYANIVSEPVGIDFSSMKAARLWNGRGL